jgi:hypothetical protein
LRIAIEVKEGQQFVKAYGIKVRCYENMLGNTFRIRDNFLKILPLPNLKGKKARHLECMLGPSHWLHEFLFPKELVTIFGLGYPLQRTPYLLVYCHNFWPRLIALPKNTLPIGPLNKQDHILILGGEGR